MLRISVKKIYFGTSGFSDALMANCSHDSREQMIEEQLVTLHSTRRANYEDMTQDPAFIQQLSEEIIAFWQ